MCASVRLSIYTVVCLLLCPVNSALLLPDSQLVSLAEGICWAGPAINVQGPVYNENENSLFKSRVF